MVKCQIGIEVISAHPFIFMNKISQNFENGIVTIAKDGLRCDSLLKYNIVEKNKDNGILCAGKENYTRIENFNVVKNNRRSGIKALEGAHITIMGNTIESNFAQGILLVESTSAHIELNNINTNYKANIAFGGDNSWDTVIHRNQIYSSRSEGIFVIESGFAWIAHNNIYDNNDGIILFDSCPWITSNTINENQRAGVIASGSSYPMMDYNHIFGNSSSGIIIRDNSNGDI
jgi:parallel beta-helix repeat protein